MDTMDKTEARDKMAKGVRDLSDRLRDVAGEPLTSRELSDWIDRFRDVDDALLDLELLSPLHGVIEDLERLTGTARLWEERVEARA